ncbi:MAG TPA: acyl-CoA dehydratase activase [Thermodesulfobacteriota bacterium]|nr:acyl-CoA dehydratase activase [Thermodesulfobacteriota bacterium]
MKAAGIDIGSRMIKLVVVERETIIHSLITDTTHDPLEQCKKLMAQTSFDKILATGYGRHFFETEFDVTTVTEIKAFARGAKTLFPNCRTILDIGGQDTKAIALDEKGSVSKFEMNDRCAAGTGMFLEVIAKTLGYGLEEFGKEALGADGNIQINSMCTVFAQSEVTSLLAKRQKREAIARGIHMAILNRTLSLLKRISTTPDIVFAGGVARNSCLRYLLGQALGCQVRVPEDPQIIGAYGAAIIAKDSGK